MRSAPASKNMFLDCIRKIIPANCTHILQKAFFKHALELGEYNNKKRKQVLFFLYKLQQNIHIQILLSKKMNMFLDFLSWFFNRKISII